MVGEEYNYYCPICKKILRRDFGATPIVGYKDLRLYINNCIECKTKLAIEPINKNENFFISTKSNKFEALVKNTISIIEGLSTNLNEEEAINKVFKELEKTYSREILKANEIELKEIIQHELCNKNMPNPKSFIYDEIKNDCISLGCIFF